MEQAQEGGILIVGDADRRLAVLELVRALPDRLRVAGFIDCRREDCRVGHLVDGIPVLDVLPCLDRHRDGATALVLAAASSRDREAIVAEADRVGLSVISATHPHAHIAADAVLCRGTVVEPGALVLGGARIGVGVALGPGVLVERGAHVGDFATLEGRVALGAGTRIGERVWLGFGSIVRDGVRIGPGACVGVGAVVTGDIAAGATVCGSPARPGEGERTHPEVV